MDRRSFLAGISGILVSAAAPAIVRSDALMRIVPRGVLVSSLDDYEEGTWEPTLYFDGVEAPRGSYTKVGNLIVVTTSPIVARRVAIELRAA